MSSASLHPYIEFSTGRAILKGGWSTCPLRCGLVLLMAVIKVILRNSSSHSANAFSAAVRYRFILIGKWSTTGHRLDHYWSPAGSLLVGGCDLYCLAYRSLLVLLVFSTFEYSLYAFIRVDLRAEYITHPYY